MTRKTIKRTAIPMLKDGAHDIWLAGLGAFALAGEEGGRVFKQLVKKGEGMEKENKVRLHQLVLKAERMQGDARHAVARLATPIEEGMTGAMHKLGVPTRREIHALTKKVEELTRVVAKGRNGARKPARKAARTRRAAATA